MADAIPVSDPGLLAAQAKAGQAGVDAYNAAISTLQTQQQNAVQTALQEAAMRGAPAGAAASQSGIINAPYDDRIASLTQGRASYEAAQAARTTRMNDYNAATLAARSYIPQQVELAVAPLRAQADFQVRNTEMEGQQRVFGIEADTRLTLAKMAAAAQAAQIAAAKAAKDKAAKASKLNQGELGALMTDRAASQLQASGSEIRRVLSANEAETLQRAGTAIEAAKRTPAEVNKNYWDLAAARYTGQAVQDYARTPRTVSTSKDPLPTEAPQAGRPAARPGYQMVFNQATRKWMEVPAPAAAAAASPTSQLAPAGTQAPSIWQQIMSRIHGTQGIAAGRQQVADLQAGVTERERGVGMRRLTAGLTSLDQSNREFAAFDPDTGRRVFATPSQVEALDPFTREMLMGATQVQGINSSEDFENIVWGTPSDPSTRSGQRTNNMGVGNPYSADVVRNAMAQVIDQLRMQGYEISDPEALNAMPKGTSIYNMLAGQSGQLDSQDAYRAMEGQLADRVKAEEKAAAAEEKARIAGEKAGTQQEESEAEEDLLGAYNRLPPNELGTAFQVRETLLNNQQAIATINTAIDQIINNWDTTRGGITASQVYTQLMQSSIDPSIKSLIPLAMFTKGLG